jgi:hypothetical protein
MEASILLPTSSELRLEGISVGFGKARMVVSSILGRWAFVRPAANPGRVFTVAISERCKISRGRERVS